MHSPQCLVYMLQIVRKIIQENPDISDKEITETLRPQGMRVLPMEIYNIRREMAALRAEGIIK